LKKKEVVARLEGGFSVMERWGERRRVNKVLEIAYRQMTLALDTVNDLHSTIEATLSKDGEKARRIIERLFRVEEEVDNLRRTVFEELTKESLPPKDREDIMNLVKNLDRIADNIKDSARNVLVLLEEDIPEELWKAFYTMSSGIVSTAAVLKESLKNLGVDNAKARALSEKVEDEENKVDKRHLETKYLLLKYGQDTNPSALLILKDLLDSMEEAADRCADTADYIRVLTVSFK
jgi:predicted phosphate transport protein (TIGR00153 family)